jgi:predicted transposase YdaD
VSAPYDAASKDLIETDPLGWVTFLGCAAPEWAVRLVDAELSTVTTESDKVIRVDVPSRWLLHIEIQSGSDASIERRVLRYNALLHARHGVPVASVIVLLRRTAEMTWLNGCLTMAPPVGPSWEFRYEVVRVWQRPVADFLNGPIGLIPFAPLADVTADDLPAVVSGMRTRIEDLRDRPLAMKLWSAAYLLMGLRFDRALIDNVLSGVVQMEESVTYQAILQRGLERGIQQGRAEGRAEGLTEGRAEEAVAMLLIFAEQKLGAPNAEQQAALRAITDPTRIEALCKKLRDVSTWDELLTGA